MKRKKQRKMKLIGEEKFLIFVIVLCLISLYAMRTFFGAQISNTKMNIEKIEYRIENQQKKNESLTMQVNELTSYENISDVIEDMGLAYNDKNIVVINK